MKNNDKKLNQLIQDENLDFIDVPLNKLPRYIEAIKNTDINVAHIQLTSKGKWAYILMSETQCEELVGISVSDIYGDEKKDPRLNILPSHIHAVPIYLILFSLIAQFKDLVDMQKNLASTLDEISESGGDED